MTTSRQEREPRRTPLLKTFFKVLALSLGGGLMFRAGTRQGSGFQPILERLDRAELNLSRIEESGSPAGVEELRQLVKTVDERGAEQMAAIGERLDNLERQMPIFINAAVSARIQDAEQRIQAEMQSTQKQTFDAFLKTVDSRITEGIGHVETALQSQSREINDLCQRMNHTDANLVRILGIVEGNHFAGLMETAAHG